MNRKENQPAIPQPGIGEIDTTTEGSGESPPPTYSENIPTQPPHGLPLAEAWTDG